MENALPTEFLSKGDEGLHLEGCGAWVTLDLLCIYSKTHGAEEKQWVCRPAQPAHIGGQS